MLFKVPRFALSLTLFKLELECKSRSITFQAQGA
jgi:hypothetical protein